MKREFSGLFGRYQKRRIGQKERGESILSILYNYILISGTTSIIFFCTLYYFKSEKDGYFIYNHILLFIFAIITSIRNTTIYLQEEKRRFSSEAFFLINFYTETGTAFLSQPVILYMFQTLVNLFDNLGVITPLLVVLPFVTYRILKFVTQRLVKKYQVALGKDQDVIRDSILAYIGYEIIGTLFIGSFVLHIVLLIFLLSKV